MIIHLLIKLGYRMTKNTIIRVLISQKWGKDRQKEGLNYLNIKINM